MGEKLTHNCYGKSDVRVTKVIRQRTRHELIEMSVYVELRGDFKASYLRGDNRKVVATDSMKNTVYVFAKRDPVKSIESFGLALADHFKQTYPQVTCASVRVHQSSWKRINVRGKPHPVAFISGGTELRTCTAVCDERQSVAGGLCDLLVLKTTDSGFRDFVRDEFTTLPDTDDRIFATKIDAWWFYGQAKVDFNAAHRTIREALLETFATHKSDSVQQTLYAMGQAALRRCKAISDISITLPNKHRLLVNLQPFGLENKNEIFVWTDEPYGSIFGHVKRS